HEYHIGGLPYLLRRVAVPVYGPPYALEPVRQRLAEHESLRDVELGATRPRAASEVGCFQIAAVREARSIAAANELPIRTPAGLLLHTEDFKIDRRPSDGEHFDVERFRERGDEGVRLLLSDSTNAWVQGRSGEERDVHEALLALVDRAPARVVVPVFA